MSAPLTLDGYPLSKSARQLLQRAGFYSAKEVTQLQPTQLAQELGITPLAALAILQQLREPGLGPDDDPQAADGERKTNEAAASSNGNGAAATNQAAPASSQPSQSIKPQLVSYPAVEPAFGESALDLMLRRQSVKPIPTLCEALDGMCGGGVPVGQITEFCGIPGCGKTQLCMQLACNVQIPKRLHGAWEGEAIYIDTEGSFMAERALAIAEGTVQHMQITLNKLQAVARQLANAQPAAPANAIAQANAKANAAAAGGVPDALSLLRKIHVYRCFDVVEQLATLKNLPRFLSSHPNVRLLVIDSVAYHFRRGFTDFAARARMLVGLAQELLAIANQFNLAVVVTNQVTTKLDGGNSVSAALAPALGESWSHSCTHRVMLDFEGRARMARLLKSPHMKAQSVPYEIGKIGVRNVPQQQPQQPHQPQQHGQQQHQQAGAAAAGGFPAAASFHPHQPQQGQHPHSMPATAAARGAPVSGQKRSLPGQQ